MLQCENNNSAHAECILETDGFNAESKSGQYLLVDYGEKLVTEMDFSRNELHKQAVSLLEKIELLWEVVRAFIILILPVITGLGLAVLSRMFLSSSMAPWIFTVFIGLTIGFIFLNLTPLTEAVSNYLDFRIYRPQFALTCKCDSCQSKQETNKEANTSDSVTENVAANIGLAGDGDTESSPPTPDLNELD